ncbi:hypothetical protein, partial [Pseudophaeobacter profundi]|uniref:hypothetical protein n=1 Tax=Pseudophaeobacter profundi TaxID=3034152 RepID=UPI00242D2392
VTAAATAAAVTAITASAASTAHHRHHTAAQQSGEEVLQERAQTAQQIIYGTSVLREGFGKRFG